MHFIIICLWNFGSWSDLSRLDEPSSGAFEDALRICNICGRDIDSEKKTGQHKCKKTGRRRRSRRSHFVIWFSSGLTVCAAAFKAAAASWTERNLMELNGTHINLLPPVHYGPMDAVQQCPTSFHHPSHHISSSTESPLKMFSTHLSQCVLW